MAIQLHSLNPLSSFVSQRPTRPYLIFRPSQCNVQSNFRGRCVATIQSQAEDKRQSSSVVYQPSIWNYHFIESLQSGYVDETSRKRAKELIEMVKPAMLDKEVDPSDRFKLIDVLQRLGLGHLYEKEIDRSLQEAYDNSNPDTWIKDDDLRATALRFRLLRQHGYAVSQDVFSGFMDQNGKFKESLGGDIMGMLSLYEASYLGAEGESILDEARDFTKTHLESKIKSYKDSNLLAQVNHSLEIPLHLRMPRQESRWYIDAYKGEENMNPIILELAKLEFNMVQEVHQRNLGHASRWWRDLGLAGRLSFARDRLVESFLWSIGVSYEPKYKRCRDWLTKVMNFVLVIDDIYDVYGSLKEIELFTFAVERWDIEAMKELPEYMKITFLALFNTTNEMAYDILMEHGWDILPYLKKTWADFIKAMFVEAKWCQTRTIPSTEEYLKNGWVSSSGTVFLVHAFFATGQVITEEVLDCLGSNPDLILGSSMICRLSNDLATSSAELERGDASSSVHCYMHEHKVSEQAARQYIKDRIMETWKLMNKSITKSPFSGQFVQLCLNLARTSLCVYQYGDGLGTESEKSKEHVLSLIIRPII